jgi:branched-chain amino acid transport system permease protein
MSEFLLPLLATGIVVGASYGLIGMGFALIYKATGIVNFAQGEVLMLTAYIAYSLAASLHLSFLPLLAVTVPAAVLIGLAIERLLMRPMLGEPAFSQVMVTIGLAVILRGVVIMIWGPNPYQFDAGLSTGVVHIGSVAFYPAQLGLIAALALICGAVWGFFRFSRIGIAMRAAASDERAALLMGIDVARVHAVAWAIAAAIAAVAGMLIAALVSVGPDLWFQGLRAFPAVILGGLDAPLGAALGGIVIGLVENLAQGYLGQGLREIAGFVMIILVLMVRPYGLFGRPDIERV